MMSATLFSFDATQWGGFAFATFLAALGYCTAYLSKVSRFKFGSAEYGGGLGRLLLPGVAFVSLFASCFASTIFLGLQWAAQRPWPQMMESRYFTEVQLSNEAALPAARIVSASVSITDYDGFSHARVFLNHRRVFESSVHCRFTHQCRRNGAHAAPPTPSSAWLDCVKHVCMTVRGGEEYHHLPMAFARPTSEIHDLGRCGLASLAPLAAAKTRVRSCQCRGESGQPCDEARSVNWQRGIDVAPHDLPFDVSVTELLLRPGVNVLEVAAENSGVGLCLIEGMLRLRTADGGTYTHPFRIDGETLLPSDPKASGPRHSVDANRTSFTTCDRQRTTFVLGEGVCGAR